MGKLFISPRTLAGLSALVLFLGLSSCKSDREQHIHLIPETCIVWNTIAMDRVRSVPALATVANLSGIRPLWAQHGLGEDDLSIITLFCLSEKGGNEAGALITGNFNRKEIAAHLLERGWKEGLYEGKRLYVNPETEDGSSFVKGDTIATGSEGLVKATLEVDRSGRASVADSASNRQLVSECVSSQAPIVVGALIPQGTIDTLKIASGVGQIALSILNVPILDKVLAKIGVFRGVALQMDHEPGKLPFRLSCLMEDEDSAAFVSGGVNMLKSLVGLMPQKDMSPQEREAVQSMKNLQVFREDSLLHVETYIPENELIRGGI
jgi:hypothetical protein